MSRLALVLTIAVAGCSTTVAPRPPHPPSTTVAPPDPHPPSTTARPVPSVTTTVLPPVAASSGRAPAAPPSAPPTWVPAGDAAASLSQGHEPTGTAHPPPAAPSAPAAGAIARASWYARGARTASGEAFDPDGLTFAHRTLAFGSTVRFCHAGACVVARCNDRGPAEWTGRDFDLSRGAFASIAPLRAGVVDVTWEAA